MNGSRTAVRPDTGRPHPDIPGVAEIICVDPELLRAEFDAIVAASFPAGLGLPAPRGPRRIAGARAGIPPRRRPRAGCEPRRRAPGGDRPPPAARERSPPRRPARYGE